MSVRLHKMDSLNISGESDESTDEFQYYEGDMSSTRRNSKYFRWSKETLGELVRQAQENKTPIYPLHSSYREWAIGKIQSCRLVDDKARTVFSIQRDLTMLGNQNTDELIRRIDAKTVDSLSTGTMGGEYRCDLDGSVLEWKSDGMFFYTRACTENGHRLGDTVKQDGRAQTVTATVHGTDVRLFELSVVSTGAVPDAKIRQALAELLDSGDITEAELGYISEINDFNLEQLCDQLSVSPTAIPRISSDPDPAVEPQPYRIVGGRNMDKSLLEQENQKLSEDLTRVAQERDALQEKLDNALDGKEIESFEKKMATLQDEVDTLTKENGQLKALTTEAEIALDTLRKEYVVAYKSACGRNKPTETEIDNLEKSLANNNNFTEIYEGTQRNWARARENRLGGQKSANALDAQTKSKFNKVEAGWTPPQDI